MDLNFSNIIYQIKLFMLVLSVCSRIEMLEQFVDLSFFFFQILGINLNFTIFFSSKEIYLASFDVSFKWRETIFFLCSFADPFSVISSKF